MEIDLAKLKGSHVYLERLAAEHVPVLHNLARDARIWEFTHTLLVTDQYDDMFTAYINTALDTSALGRQQAFVIRRTVDNGIIGMTRLYEIVPADKRLLIGHTWYIPSAWGKVYNKECKFLLLQYVFEEWKFNRVAFYVAHQNIRSQKAMEKIGAVKEGVLRKHGYRNDGSLRDTVVYSIINDEWPGKKEKLRQLLASAQNQ
jgi:RimJ/RimL family protein N-acetyltransferase